MLLKIIIPVILFVGSLGNMISIYVFTRPSLKGLSTFKFLAYLSLIDYLYLLVGLPHIIVIAYANYDFRNYSDFVCSVHSFLTLYLSHLSSNILAAVGVFRCVTLTSLRPLKPATRVVKATSTAATNATCNVPTHVSVSMANSQRHAVNGGFNANNSNVAIASSNQKTHTKIIYSRGSQPEGFLLKRLISNIDNADLVVAAIAFVIFLFDCHFLFLMRLEYFDTTPNTNETMSSSNIINGSTTSLNSTNNANNSSSSSSKIERSFVLICYPNQERSRIYYDFYTQVYIWIDQFLYSYIPFAIMIVSTIIIIHRLITINKQLKSKTTTTTTTNTNSTTINTPSKQHMNGKTGKEVQEMTESEPMMMQQQQQNQSQQATPKSIHNKHGGRQVGSSSTGTAGPIGEAGKLALAISQSPLLRVSLADKLSRRKCELIEGTATATTTTTSRQSDVAKRRSKKNSQIYKLLLTLNIFFFVLVTPLVFSNSLGWLKEGQNVTTQIVYTFAYLNHALNFVFYGFSCKMYRSIVYDMFF